MLWPFAMNIEPMILNLSTSFKGSPSGQTTRSSLPEMSANILVVFVAMICLLNTVVDCLNQELHLTTLFILNRISSAKAWSDTGTLILNCNLE